MRKGIKVFCLLLCVGLAGCRGKSAEAPIPPEDANRKNPIEATPASIDDGKRSYDLADCAMCHGKQGDGKGVLAKDTNMNTRNWQDPATLAHFSDGELSYIVVKGKGRMPGYENRKSADEIWKMIVYIRSLSGNQPSPRS